MAFIKVGSTVINTAAIATVHLHDDKVQITFNYAGTEDDYACLGFKGAEAEALRKYFSKTGNVVNLTD